MQVTTVNKYVRIYAAKPRNSFGRIFEVRYILDKVIISCRTHDVGQAIQALSIMYVSTFNKVIKVSFYPVKVLKNNGIASRAEYTQSVMKKYVRFITSSCLTLCRRCNSNLLFIQAALQKPPKWKYWTLKRSLQPLQIFHKIGVLKNFAKIHRKALVLKSPFESQGLQLY